MANDDSTPLLDITAPHLVVPPGLKAEAQPSAAALAFLPPADLQVAPFSRVLSDGAELTFDDDALTLAHHGRASSIAWQAPCTVLLSRSGGAAHDTTLHLELRQQVEGGWTSLGLSCPSAELGAPITALPRLERSFVETDAATMTTVLAALRAHLREHGREDWGLVGEIALPAAAPPPADADSPEALPATRTEKILRGLTITHSPTAIEIHARWWRWSFVGWFVIGVYMMLVGDLLATGTGLALLVAGTLASAVGLVSAINRTVLRAEPGLLEIRPRPLPVARTTRIGAAELRQIYCREVAAGTDGLGGSRFEVIAQLDGGHERTLVRGLERAEQALAIERALEAFLGIEDKPVWGEIAPRKRALEAEPDDVG